MAAPENNPSEVSAEVSADEGKPPFFRTWNGVYALVLVTLAVCIAVFALLTHVYS